MAGLRIRHSSRTNCMFTLVDSKRAYQAPVRCTVCMKEHNFKTYHIALDDAGCAIVSQEVWDRLNSLPLNPFSPVNTVEKPPALLVGIGGVSLFSNVVEDENLKEPS